MLLCCQQSVHCDDAENSRVSGGHVGVQSELSETINLHRDKKLFSEVHDLHHDLDLGNALRLLVRCLPTRSRLQDDQHLTVTWLCREYLVSFYRFRKFSSRL